MKEFMGIKNVIDAVAILGKDGNADGFKIIYQEPRKVRIGRRVIEKMVEKEIVKYVREYNPLDTENDGSIHGFGRGTVYTRSSKKRRATAKKGIKMTSSGLKAVTNLLRK